MLTNKLAVYTFLQSECLVRSVNKVHTQNIICISAGFHFFYLQEVNLCSLSTPGTILCAISIIALKKKTGSCRIFF